MKHGLAFLWVVTTRQIGVWVRPGASRPGVGGMRADDLLPDHPLLIVAVKERAVEGAATAAVVNAVADAFGVPRKTVSCVSGFSHRRKILRIADPPANFDDVLQRLLSG